MKTTTVPAQVTTVEDKIAGSLTLSQLMLLIAPLFIGSAIYLIFPPSMHLTPFKFIVSFMILVLAGFLSIRVKGKIILFWAVIILRYLIRPRHYVFNKNDMYLRNVSDEIEEDNEILENTNTSETKQALALGLEPFEQVRLEHAMADPRSKLHFTNQRKGGLSVHITEVK